MPPNIVALTTALVQRWPMTNLLDILKETELRVHFTEAVLAPYPGESSPQVLQHRLLLCLYGLGTNAVLNAWAAEEARIGMPTYNTFADAAL